jgi:hypothetical protein
MNYIVITVMLTAVCAAFLFAQEAEELSKEKKSDKSHSARLAVGAPVVSGPAAAAGIATACALESLSDMPETAWEAPRSGIHIAGTSRMGAQTVAIINGKFSGIGDLVEVRHDGRMYQWKIRRIQPDGKVNLERYAVKTETADV